MQFDYWKRSESLASANVDNIGNCFIEAIGNLNQFYYLWIQTETGVSRIVEAGPISPVDEDVGKCNITYVKDWFNEKKIAKRIRFFLNSYGITTARDIINEYPIDELKEKITNPLKFIGENKNG